MSERIGRLNGATRAEKHDCDDEQVFHDGLLVVVTQNDDCGATACRADFGVRSKRFSRNGHEIEPQPAQRKVLPPWENR